MKVIAKLSTRLFNSDAVRDAFVNGWVDAGGTTGDCESATPWCCRGFGLTASASNGMRTSPRLPASLMRRPQRIKSARLTGPQSAPKYSH